MKVYISFVILSFLYLYEEFGKFGLALRKWKNETQMPDFYRELPIIRLRVRVPLESKVLMRLYHLMGSGTGGVEKSSFILTVKKHFSSLIWDKWRHLLVYLLTDEAELTRS